MSDHVPLYLSGGIPTPDAAGSADVPSVPNVASTFDSVAPELVTEGWAQAQSYASEAFTVAQDFIEQLSTAAASIADLPPINVDVGVPTTVISPFVMPDSPVAPDMTTEFPTAPAEPTLGTVDPLTIADAPTFDVAAPAVNTDLTPPSPLTAEVPASPELDAIFYPTEPSISLPTAPSLFDIVLPDAPVLEFIDFYSSHEPGEVPLAPDIGINFVEPAFDDALMTLLKNRLEDWVSGTATGLPPDVEQAIWERGRARENINMIAATDTVLAQWSARGFTLPQGAQVTQTQMLALETATKNSTLSREVMIEQAKLEQANIHFAIEQSVKLEGDLLTYANAVAQRAFEAAKAAAMIAVDLFNARVSSYNASIQAYLADAQVYRIRIEAETRKVELYRAQIEAQRVIGELNQQMVALYHEQISAQLATIEIYKAQLEAVKVQADVNKLKIESFRALIEAYVAQVQAKTAEYEQYATQIKAEGLKVDVYKAQSDAYNSVINGYAKNVDALIALKNMDIKLEQELPLEVYKSLIAAFAQQVDGEAKRVGALADVYKSEVQAYSAEVGGEASRVDSETKVYKAEADRLIAQAQVQVEAAKAELTAMTAQLNAVIEAMRAGATVASQLAAAALSAVNLSGSISDSNSTSQAHQTSMQGVAYNSSTNSSSRSFNGSLSQSISYSNAGTTSESWVHSDDVRTDDVTTHNYNYNYNGGTV